MANDYTASRIYQNLRSFRKMLRTCVCVRVCERIEVSANKV